MDKLSGGYLIITIVDFWDYARSGLVRSDEGTFIFREVWDTETFEIFDIDDETVAQIREWMLSTEGEPNRFDDLFEHLTDPLAVIGAQELRYPQNTGSLIFFIDET